MVRIKQCIALMMGLGLLTAIILNIQTVTAVNTTTIIKPSTLTATGWGFLQESPSQVVLTGTFSTGPDTPPLGNGSASLSLLDATEGKLVGTQTISNTRFADITRLEYSTYVQSAGNPNVTPSLQFNVDYDLTAGDPLTPTWQGRLVYEPTIAGLTITPSTWQTWNPMTGAGWWATGAPGNTVCTQGAPCTWAQILTEWPEAGIQAGAFAGTGLKAGSGWASGFSGNVDALIIGIGSDEFTFDFEPETPCTTNCYVNSSAGNDAFGGDTPTSAKQTIQAGIDQVNTGGNVIVASGIYTGNIALNKHISLIGTGSGPNSASNTILQKVSNSPLVTLTASGASTVDPILLQDLRLEPVNVIGIDVPASTAVSNIKLENIQIIGTNETNDTENERGLNVNTTGSITHLEIDNSAFDNLTYGWYFAKHGDWGPGGSTVSNIIVNNSSFSNNDVKGIYVEKLSDATFQNSTVHNNGINTGFWNARWNAGFDINLKGQETYQNLLFENMVFSNNGLAVRDGVALMIKARDDGATYGANPASLANVTIRNSFITGNERGIRLGEPTKNNATPTNVTITDNAISGNVQTYGGVDGSVYGGVINETQTAVSALNNWWGAGDGPGLVASGSGDMISTNVTYDPWLCDGTDASPDFGFQPASPQYCYQIYLPVIFKQ